ncbi:alkaline phosphatase family protein [Pseudanabaena sp. 'Roaring Creek']|uniref:alkaline phosphatase family protein n=1 Tax=Pseudanabaena sp. 'Roaring Creek' TaxID=1681830 RepID=UPI0006D807BE|nr:alkaline phosphatase family protein [Pseudanabaena sp. 'Roaring Creek']
MKISNAKASASFAVALSATVFSSSAFVAAVSANSLTEGVPQYDHQIVIMMENHGYDEIIGSPYTPYINQLANTYNTETNFFSTTHPSLPNYLTLISGSTFGNGAPFDPIQANPNLGNDNPPCISAGHFAGPTTAIPSGASQNCNATINSPSIVDQLATQSLTWKTYQENLPADKLAANSNTAGVNDKLYAVKHNPFLYFNTVQSDPNQLKNVVGFDQLGMDLTSGALPNFSFIAPNQCNDMHGDPSGGCPYGVTDPADANEQANLTKGDNEVKNLVSAITSSAAWSKGNNIIYLTWDENDYGTGTNQVPLIAITNNGYQGVRDGTYGNTCSLLRTIEDGFGINNYLGCAGDATALTSLVTPVPNPSMELGIASASILFGVNLLRKKRPAKLNNSL